MYLGLACTNPQHSISSPVHDPPFLFITLVDRSKVFEPHGDDKEIVVFAFLKIVVWGFGNITSSKRKRAKLRGTNGHRKKN